MSTVVQVVFTRKGRGRARRLGMDPHAVYDFYVTLLPTPRPHGFRLARDHDEWTFDAFADVPEVTLALNPSSAGGTARPSPPTASEADATA